MSFFHFRGIEVAINTNSKIEECTDVFLIRNLYQIKCFKAQTHQSTKKKQSRTNGPINAHLTIAQV